MVAFSVLMIGSGSSQMLSGLAGGMVPKGGHRDLKPWLTVGNQEGEAAEDHVPGQWEGIVGEHRVQPPRKAIFTAERDHNWSDYYGLRLELGLAKGQRFDGEVRLHTPLKTAKSGYKTAAPVITTAKFSVIGTGKVESVDLPFAAFDHFHPFSETFRQIKKIEIGGSFPEGQKAFVTVARVRVITAPMLKLYSPVRSRGGGRNEVMEYDVKVMNCSDELQSVVLSHHPFSKHVMTSTLRPAQLILKPGETRSCLVSVNVTDRVPPGGRERQKIVAVANGRWGGDIELITGRKLPHPYLVHTPERWQGVRDKVENYDWAKNSLKRYLEHKANDNRPGSRWPHAVAWQISRDRKHAEAAKPGVRFDVGGKDLIQAVEIYDMIADSGVFTKEDHDRIAREMRDRLWGITMTGVANLELQEARCGFTLALGLQDFAWFEHFFYATDGVYDNIANGIMPDGWWYEGSVNYNVWVSRYICKMALAAEPFGINMIEGYFTPGYSKEFRRLTDDPETRKREFGGKPFQKFGKHPVPRITLDMLWDSFIDHIAYDGQMYAANDGGEWSFTDDEAFELAYMMWPKPTYAALVKRRGPGGRSLLYGVPDLPEETPNLGLRSAFSDGIGFITLRSQTPDRHPSQQIEISLKYGTHGAYHGHFDRISFNSLRRYDRNLYTSGHGLWYSYASFMYGMFVQSSVNHNMVVVDGRNQESVESTRLLFHSGPKMQAAVVETNARWSCPPYLGLQMRRPNPKEGESITLTGRERLALEDVYVPAAVDGNGKEPEVADIGDWSERILQRRLAVVTDHYVVLADFMKGEEEHTYDNLLHVRGFQGIEGAAIKRFRHSEQMDPNPRLATQLITNCQWWRKDGTSKSRFRTIYDDRSSLNWRSLKGKKGDLYLDVYSAWPKQGEIMVGAAPEVRARAGWTKYTVAIDDRVVAEEEFSPWILGRKDLNLKIPAGAKKLVLKTQNEDRRKGGGFILTREECLFWGGGQLKLANGKSHSFTELQKKGQLVLKGLRTDVHGRPREEPIRSGEDYRQGPVVIAGMPFRETLPAQPQGAGEVVIDLTALKAESFSVSLGADYPQGKVTKYQRNTFSARTKGKTARFLTVIEPFEKVSEVKVREVEALSADELRIVLSDGTVQAITIDNLEGDEQPRVTLTEAKEGGLVTEQTGAQN